MLSIFKRTKKGVAILAIHRYNHNSDTTIAIYNYGDVCYLNQDGLKRDQAHTRPFKLREHVYYFMRGTNCFTKIKSYIPVKKIFVCSIYHLKVS
ncbi:hypothetical protein HanIR_Chr17g0901321 [Helianthus annuus]|nr:hypothetical protein HanIR_Chr17g0901321 [Helianthus annuus]